MDKLAAVEEAGSQDIKQRGKWCPLTGTFCNPECVVYLKAKVIERRIGDWGVKPGYCNAHCLVGP